MMLNQIKIHYIKHNRKIDSGLAAFFLFMLTLVLAGISFMYFAKKRKLLVKTISDYIQELMQKQPHNPLLHLINGNRNLFSTLDSFASSAYAKFTKILIVISMVLAVIVTVIVILKLYNAYQNKKDCKSSTQNIHKKNIDFVTFPLVFFGSFTLTGIALIIPLILSIPKSLVEFLSNRIDALERHNNGMIGILKGLIDATFKENDIVQKTIDKTRNTLFIITLTSLGVCIIVALFCIIYCIKNKNNCALITENKDFCSTDFTAEDSVLKSHSSVQIEF